MKRTEAGVFCGTGGRAGRKGGNGKNPAAVLAGMVDRGLQLLFPPALYCICCGNLIDGSRTYHLCDHCISHIRFDGNPVQERNGVKMLQCTRYGIYERTLIFSLKYNGKTWIARDIAEICADRLELAGLDFDVIVPVPLYREKERQRGFNQAALIGGFLAGRTGKICIDHGLLRTRKTLPMRGLSPEERQQNVKGSFALNERYIPLLKGRQILLIDDFYTTGSTAAECSQALKAAEPADVHFLAFAAR